MKEVPSQREKQDRKKSPVKPEISGKRQNQVPRVPLNFKGDGRSDPKRTGDVDLKGEKRLA